MVDQANTLLKEDHRKNEPPLDKINKMTCAPSEDSDRPGHLPSLLRVFHVRMKKKLALKYLLSASEDSDQNGRMPRLIRIFAGHTSHFVCCFCRAAAQIVFRCVSYIINAYIIIICVVLNFWRTVYYPGSKQQRSRCAGWSAPLLFAYGINSFSHDVAPTFMRSSHSDQPYKNIGWLCS